MKRSQIQEPKPEYVAKSGATLQRKDGKIWSHIRRKWLVETPEESVRQEYLLVLLHEYDYDLEQMDEEVEVTGRGWAAPGPTSLSGVPLRTRPTASPRWSLSNANPTT